MGIETNNNGQGADNGSNNSGNANSADDRGGTVDGVDPTISKHLDLAIEAQDGPKDANATKTNAASTEGEADKGKQQTGSQSSTGDSSAQSGDQTKDPAVTEAARTLAGAKDLRLTDGTVVKGGAERRFYEQREIARSQLATTQTDLGNLRQEHKALQEKYETLENSTKQLHGVDPKILSVGATIVTDLQRDPVGTIKKLLAETAAQGYNVADLGVGIDTAAITRLLEERLPTNKPKEKTDAELEAEATAEVSQFYSQFPDARPHDKLLAAVLRDHPELDMRSAYYAVKSGFAEKGFDWSLSLEDNLKAVASSGDGNNQGNNTNQNQQKPLPNGGNGGNGEFKLNDSAVADDSMDTGDIVKQAMREAGMNI
jgi:hypothetical protein